uniref:Uncharacterized protein n=1 Tax=Porodaedalea pini TaxID=108901 RepID=A0A5B9RC02_9AGAM|nr:hypothetical protein PPIT_000052 [Porodaedalea pini]QEG56933.1 hypothetical protein PPIT_000052 [Porodaedalea pini]
MYELIYNSNCDKPKYKNKMKIMNNSRQILFALSILLATAMIAIFLYDLLSNLGSDNVAHVTSNNNVILNNQMSVRSVQNASNFTTNVTYPSATENLTNPGTLAVTIIFSALGLILIVAGGYSLLVCYGLVSHPLPIPAAAAAVIEAGAESFLNQ